MASRAFFNTHLAAVAKRGLRFHTTEAVAGQSSFAAEHAAVREHAATSSATWLKISYFAVIVVIPASAANAYYLLKKHQAHAKEHPRQFVKYEYVNIRQKVHRLWGIFVFTEADFEPMYGNEI
ncbi:hypothetical protein BC938DRAFT_477669 [Jimgerdemannia flammicorona]|uniref:Cytochrome c oxidase, subunit VIa n=1 Tax=Jimgerdemannia flammicorona TaxID=994334 RepID=A0A433QYS8_9FUNG|nr:hypothetical protein BC938DRAFT_477669 [Jimgerdemannia flammicorona]